MPVIPFFSSSYGDILVEKRLRLNMSKRSQRWKEISKQLISESWSLVEEGEEPGGKGNMQLQWSLLRIESYEQTNTSVSILQITICFKQ